MVHDALTNARQLHKKSSRAVDMPSRGVYCRFHALNGSAPGEQTMESLILLACAVTGLAFGLPLISVPRLCGVSL
jgi:hypothetical protein